MQITHAFLGVILPSHDEESFLYIVKLHLLILWLAFCNCFKIDFLSNAIFNSYSQYNTDIIKHFGKCDHFFYPLKELYKCATLQMKKLISFTVKGIWIWSFFAGESLRYGLQKFRYGLHVFNEHKIIKIFTFVKYFLYISILFIF